MSEKEALLPTKRNFCDCFPNIGHFLYGVERVKRFVNVHLHCIVSNLKRIRKLSTLPPGKISADAYVRSFEINHLILYLLTDVCLAELHQ